VEELGRVYEALLAALRKGEPAAVATVIGASASAPRRIGAKMVVYSDGRTVGTVGGGRGEARVIEAALAALRDGKPREAEFATAEGTDEAACAGSSRVLIEVLPVRPTVLIVGAGHVGQALAVLAAFLGYRVVVIDERVELLTSERFPHADQMVPSPPDEALRDLPLGAQTFVVFVTPHQARDELALAVLAQRPVAYIALMGGHRRTKATFDRARELGVPSEFLSHVHTPAGLSIGAESPREIAVSIVAEIIGVARGHQTP
jgi:xanthine dehydrogenase accessory factor